MPKWCLVKDKAKKFLTKIKSREIDIDQMVGMTSSERRGYLKGILGFSDDTIKAINAEFESKLILKYQKTGIKNWIERVGGMKEPVKRDLLTKTERLDKTLENSEMFLEDLAQRRLGIGITEEQSKRVFDMTKQIADAKAKITPDMKVGSKERIDYGLKLVQFQDYMAELKLATQKMGFIDYVKKPQEVLYSLGGATKSMLATLDNSFFGRQGIKTLYTSPTKWTTGFLKSWVDIARVLKGKGLKRVDGMLPIKADIWSRPNAMNNRYQKMGLDVGLDFEEAFPSSLPSKIPLLGRVFDASETAFSGGAMRMRADLADKYLKLAESQGIDIDDVEELIGIGRLVNSTTGRGSIGKAEAMGREINALFFSIKFLKSNIDTITAHLFDAKATAFTKKQAAKNLLKIVGGIASILTTSYMLDEDSVELDPRSSDFGKIKVGDTRIDITGGMGSLVVLASRLMPTKRKGKWGFWQKSATSGKWTDLTGGKYGQRTALDVFENFWEGKLSPMAGLLRDIWRGSNWDREKVNIKNATKNLTMPISAQQLVDYLDSDEDTEKIITFMILDMLGYSTYSLD